MVARLQLIEALSHEQVFANLNYKFVRNYIFTINTTDLKYLPDQSHGFKKTDIKWVKPGGSGQTGWRFHVYDAAKDKGTGMVYIKGIKGNLLVL